jgi:sugar/nucleoside kinase (ribokinase family)
MRSVLWHANPKAAFSQVVGVGGIGTGTIIELEGNQTLGRTESRMGQALDARDYCKLHIVEHYISVLMGTGEVQNRFQVFAVGNVGGDAAGATLIREMVHAGIDTRYVLVEPERSTLFSVCFLYPDKSAGNITTSNSAACALSNDQLNECRQELAAAGSCGIALCLPEVSIDARREFLRIATECESYRIASFASAEMKIARELNLLSQVDLLALNYEEAAAVAGDAFPGDSKEHLLDACSKQATAANPNMRILVSAGTDGICVFDDGTWSHHPTVPVEAISTAGAGDALLAGTIVGLAVGLPLANRSGGISNRQGDICSATDLGLMLAAYSVTSPHTIHPDVTLESLVSFAEGKGIIVSQD